MNRRFLFLTVSITCAVLILFSSCRKKGETESGEPQSETAAVVETPVMAAASETAVFSDKKDDDDEIFSPSPVVIEAENTKTERGAETTTGSERETEMISPSEEAVDAIEDYPVITEEESGDDTVFEGYFSYRGIESLICVGRTSTTLTIPDGVTYEDILTATGLVSRRYPLEASLVIYDITEGKVVLTYPEQTQEYLVAALEYLESEAVEYIDSIYSRSETEETEAEEMSDESAEESPVFSETLSYKGYVSTIEVYTSYAFLTLPEGMESDDIVYVATLINDEYPKEASLVTYTLEDGILTLYYPEQSEEYLLSALDILTLEAVRLIDSIEEEAQAPLEEKTLPLVETVEVEREPGPETTDLTVLPKAGETAEVADDAERELSSPEVGRMEKVVRGFSIAAYVIPEYAPSFSDKGWTPLNFGAGVKFEADLTKSVALGLSVQYDFSRFIEAGTYLRWTFADMERVKVYSTLGFGGVFGVPDNSGNNSLFISGGVGCEYFFTPSFSLFGEAKVEWSKSLGFETGMEIGLRYSF